MQVKITIKIILYLNVRFLLFYTTGRAKFPGIDKMYKKEAPITII